MKTTTTISDTKSPADSVKKNGWCVSKHACFSLSYMWHFSMMQVYTCFCLWNCLLRWAMAMTLANWTDLPKDDPA